MPTFTETRRLIQDAAAQLGVKMPGNRAKSLACALLTQDSARDEVAGVDYRRVVDDYADPTGEDAVRHVLMWLAGIVDPEAEED